MPLKKTNNVLLLIRSGWDQGAVGLAAGFAAGLPVGITVRITMGLAVGVAVGLAVGIADAGLAVGVAAGFCCGHISGACRGTTVARAVAAPWPVATHGPCRGMACHDMPRHENLNNVHPCPLGMPWGLTWHAVGFTAVPVMACRGVCHGACHGMPWGLPSMAVAMACRGALAWHTVGIALVLP